MPSSDYAMDRTNIVCRKSAVGITNMIMAAACYPEAQKRVQEELDMVVGKDRSKCHPSDIHEYLENVVLVPTWEDSESLPQVHAYLLETFRWRPIVSIGGYFLE